MITKNTFNPECITYSQMNLIFNARIYYRRLTTWTRAYILSSFLGIGTAEELFNRLYIESLNIGKMLQLVFGREYTDQYSQLLSQYALIFRDLISAYLEGNTEAAGQNVTLLYENVAERAVLLEQMNPYWSEAEYIRLFDAYIRYTIEDVTAIAAGDFRRDMEIYDLLAAHTNIMGDVFAQGLSDYITSDSDSLTNQAGVQCVTYDEMNEIYNIRMFWFELVTWVRNYMISRYLGLGNTAEVYARLQQVPVDYVNRSEKIFGERIAEDYIQLFYTYIELIDAFITAQTEDNIDEIDQITQRLYQNADERAAFVASINPFWNEEDARSRLYNNLRDTIFESTFFLARDYARNIDIFSRILDQAESISNWLARGLFDYINYYQREQLSPGAGGISDKEHFYVYEK